jgi:hypothetical protein
MENKFLYSSYQCNNDELFRNVVPFYFREGDRIADVTYGKGVFWKKINTSNYDFFKSDLLTCPETPYDFKKLPYDNEFFNGVVFDPPYVHNPGRLIVDSNYRNADTTKGFYHKDIINLYRLGMIESNRVLKKDGFLLVKCKDEIESSKQYMSHIEVHDIAIREMEMIVKDLFVLTQNAKPCVQFKNQKHARKNHSYLWVFQKIK